jgi:hypothetical protein
LCRGLLAGRFGEPRTAAEGRVATTDRSDSPPESRRQRLDALKLSVTNESSRPLAAIRGSPNQPVSQPEFTAPRVQEPAAGGHQDSAISGRSPSVLNFGRDEASDDSFAAMSLDRSPARAGHQRPVASRPQLGRRRDLRSQLSGIASAALVGPTRPEAAERHCPVSGIPVGTKSLPVRSSSWPGPPAESSVVHPPSRNRSLQSAEMIR